MAGKRLFTNNHRTTDEVKGLIDSEDEDVGGHVMHAPNNNRSRFTCICILVLLVVSLLVVLITQTQRTHNELAHIHQHLELRERDVSPPPAPTRFAARKETDLQNHFNVTSKGASLQSTQPPRQALVKKTNRTARIVSRAVDVKPVLVNHSTWKAGVPPTVMPVVDVITEPPSVGATSIVHADMVNASATADL